MYMLLTMSNLLTALAGISGALVTLEKIKRA